MKQTHPVRTALALAFSAGLGVYSLAQAQQQPPGNDGAPMVQPPRPASGPPSAGTPSNPANPDNMPVKRPSQSTGDRILRAPPPASAAIAK